MERRKRKNRSSVAGGREQAREQKENRRNFLGDRKASTVHDDFLFQTCERIMSFSVEWSNTMKRVVACLLLLTVLPACGVLVPNEAIL